MNRPSFPSALFCSGVTWATVDDFFPSGCSPVKPKALDQLLGVSLELELQTVLSRLLLSLLGARMTMHNSALFLKPQEMGPGQEHTHFTAGQARYINADVLVDETSANRNVTLFDHGSL